MCLEMHAYKLIPVVRRLSVGPKWYPRYVYLRYFNSFSRQVFAEALLSFTEAANGILSMRNNGQ